jgi:hypothetical protein
MNAELQQLEEDKVASAQKKSRKRDIQIADLAFRRNYAEGDGL